MGVETPTATRTALLTAVVLIAFAGNSVLARAALFDGSIGALEFTAVRFAGGALALAPFLGGALGHWRAKLPGALALTIYGVAFSLAYLDLPAGTGALLLFGFVQVTMIGVGLRSGERPSPRRMLGFTIAVAGLIWLVAPGVGAPDPTAAASMAIAGVAWGAYTLAGRGVADPTRSTATNFLIATPLVVLATAIAGEGPWSARGVALAAASGVLTSGLGYVLWYAALRGHSAISAAIVQLLVPAIAALGGVIFLAEELTARLVGSGLVTLAGVALAILATSRPAANELDA